MEILSVTSAAVMYAAIAIACTVFAAVSGVLIFVTLRLIKRQIKLYNSITLVELKSTKWYYFIFILILAFFVFYLATQCFDASAPEVKLMADVFGMSRWQSVMVLGFGILLLLCAEFFLIVLTVAKSAVVDKGVYTAFGYLDWYHVHNYIINEDTGTVILTSSKNTFLTLSGTTPPLKAVRNDIPKLKFILNKNKNKFSGFSSDEV